MTNAPSSSPKMVFPENELPPIPRGSYLPLLPNPLFTDRAKALSAIASASGHLAICGTSGIGKTQLAIQSAWQTGRRYRGLHWLDLRDPNALDTQIMLCGNRMDISPWPATLPDQANATLAAWKEDGPRLLVLDNVREMEFTRQAVTRFQHASLRLVLISRSREIPTSLGIPILDLEPFNPQESLEFFGRAIGTNEARASAALVELIELIGGFPLAMDIVVKTIQATSISVQDYLARLQATLADRPRLEKWFNQGGVSGPTPLDQVWLAVNLIAWEHVIDEVPRKLFIVSGYCTPDTSINARIYKEVLKIDHRSLNHGLDNLGKLGLMQTGEEGTRIHPLQALFARSNDRNKGHLLQTLAEKLSVLAIQANSQAEESGQVYAFASLRPHIFSVAHHAEVAGIHDAANLFWNLGHYSRMVSDHACARTCYEHALRIDEAAFGPEHPSVALDVSNLGTVLLELGNTVEAKAALETALNINTAIYGPDHPELAADINNLAAILQNSGDLKGARKEYERAVKIKESAFGPQHHSLVPLLVSLGKVHELLGNLDSAQRAYERALRINEKHLGAEHQSMAALFSNLGMVCKGKGDMPSAKTAFEHAVRISSANRNEKQPAIASYLGNLAGVLLYMGNLQEARDTYQQALHWYDLYPPGEEANIKAIRNKLTNIEKMIPASSS